MVNLLPTLDPEDDKKPKTDVSSSRHIFSQHALFVALDLIVWTAVDDIGKRSVHFISFDLKILMSFALGYAQDFLPLQQLELLHL